MNVTAGAHNAFMGGRIEPKNSLDDFPTQPWATRALCQHVLWPRLGSLTGLTAWEPACNRGYMAEPLKEYFGSVYASDVADYGYGGQDGCFSFLEPPAGNPVKADWIISNPPFILAADFIGQALQRAECGVAMFLKTQFVEGIDRYMSLYAKTPPTVVAQFAERVPLIKGRVSRHATTMTAYAWFVWIKDQPPRTALEWIPPCRSTLERPGDYPPEEPGEKRKRPVISNRKLDKLATEARKAAVERQVPTCSSIWTLILDAFAIVSGGTSEIPLEAIKVQLEAFVDDTPTT